MKGRKNGCPVSIKNWLVYILDVSSSTFTRIYGLTSMSRSIDSNTEDGSSDTDVWSEPYVTKRSSSVSLEGKEVINGNTGEKDEGQEMLDTYVEYSGCDADATLKFVDPYGHAWVADYIVTSRELSVSDSESTVSWEMEQVGEAEILPFNHVQSITLKDGSLDASTLSFVTGDAAKIITVDFTPTTASNKRFKVSNNRKSVCTVGNITETGFTLTPVSVGTATITVTTINGEKVANCVVTVTAY